MSWSTSVFWIFFFIKQKTAYEMRISDWSSDVCSSDLFDRSHRRDAAGERDTCGKYDGTGQRAGPARRAGLFHGILQPVGAGLPWLGGGCKESHRGGSTSAAGAG